MSNACDTFKPETYKVEFIFVALFNGVNPLTFKDDDNVVLFFNFASQDEPAPTAVPGPRRGRAAAACPPRGSGLTRLRGWADGAAGLSVG